MSKPKIALIVDHPIRDLPGLALIAYELANQNCDVYLVPMYVQERECLALCPDFVLLNYFRKNNESFVEKLVASSISFGINDTEGGFYGDLKFYGNLLSKNTDLYKHMSCNLVWGQKMFDYLKHEFPIKQNLVLTGLPRFDFYSPQFKNVKLDFLPIQLRDKSMLLINTKVALINPLFVSVEREIDLYKNKLGFSQDTIDHFIKYGKLSITDNVHLAQELAEKYPESQTIIRPHPHENDKTYSDLIDKNRYPQISVYRDGPVAPWILNSKAIIHRHCTTAIEAALAGKPALSPQWVNTSANAPDAEKVSHLIRSKPELNEKIQAALNDQLEPTPEIINALQRITDDWLYKVDGNSHVRVAHAILADLKTAKKNQNKARQLMYEVFNSHSGVTGKAYHLFNKTLKHAPQLLWQIEKNRLAKWKNTQKYFTPEDVLRWIKPVSDFQNKNSPQVSWASEEHEYFDQYPGISVKISK